MIRNLPSLIRAILPICLAIISFSCTSNNEEECLKTITIPQFFTVANQTYRYDVEQEVPCDIELVTEPVNIEPPLLENFTYEVIHFEYTSDTGNNTSRLQFEVKLNNLNNYSVNGVPYFTMRVDGLEFLTSYAELLSEPCRALQANSSCIVTLDVEESRDIGFANSFELLDVKYYLTE